MAGKIPWYAKDPPYNRDPYARQRAEIKRLEGQLGDLYDRWYALKESYEYFDGEVEIELDYLRAFLKENKS